MHSDTSIEAARLRIQVLRDLGGEVRLQQALDLSEAVRRLADLGRQQRSAPGKTTTSAGAT